MADPTSMSNSKDPRQTLNNALNGSRSNDSFDSILSDTQQEQTSTKNDDLTKSIKRISFDLY